MLGLVLLTAACREDPSPVPLGPAPQQTTDPTPAQMMQMRMNLEKASGKIRGLQATVTEHEKNIEALRKELGALKP